MYLIRFLPNFAVFCAFMWISRDFADLPEFPGSATARNIRSPVYNISFFWLLPLDSFQFIFFVPCLLRDSENDWSLQELAPLSRLFLKTFVVFSDPADRSWVSVVRGWPMGVSWCSRKFCWWLCLVPRLSQQKWYLPQCNCSNLHSTQDDRWQNI